MPDLMGAKKQEIFWDFLFLTASGGGYSVFNWLQFYKVKWNKILILIRQFINIVSNIIWNGIKNLHIINIF